REPSAASAVRFHTRSVFRSRLEVATRSTLPRPPSRPIASTTFSEMYLSIAARSGVDAAYELDASTEIHGYGVYTSEVTCEVYISRSVASSPRNAKTAIKAPVLDPVTRSNSGRVPEAPHPSISPAPKAPFCPPL